MNYQEILAGRVALPDAMDCSLNTFARRLAEAIDREQAKAFPDTALIALLCDAARLGWNYIELATAPIEGYQPIAHPGSGEPLQPPRKP
jgi:hypothetical protein